MEKRLINLSKELEKIEKEKLKLRASEFRARQDSKFWKKRAEIPIENFIKKISDELKIPNRDVIEKDKLVEMLNSNDSKLDEMIIIACKLSDLKYLKKEANLFKIAKKLEKRVEKLEDANPKQSEQEEVK